MCNGTFFSWYCVPVYFSFAAIFKDKKIEANVRFKGTVDYIEIDNCFL